MPKSGVRAGWLARCAVAVSLGVQAGTAGSQQQATQLPADVRAALEDLAGQAQVIFAGQVESVTRGGGDDASGYVDVHFRVERSLRGCAAGETYTVREWAGVWAAQAEHYRVGRRLLMLLTAPGKGGLSSPVGGQDGAIPLLATAAGPVWTAVAGAAADAGGAAEDARSGAGNAGGAAGMDALVPDLRWVQARATRVVKPGRQAKDWAGAAAPMAPLTLGTARATTLVRLRDVASLLARDEVASRAPR